VADLLISRERAGVSLIKSTDPFDTLEIHRIERATWRETPESPGIYLLYGTGRDGRLTAYIGKSEVNLRARIAKHHANPNKNWFGVLFAVPLPNALLCSAIEAELIGEANDAGVVDVVANIAAENRHRGINDVHIEPAMEKIREALQLVLGNDIFTPRDEEPLDVDPPVERPPMLSREGRGRAASPRPRTEGDPPNAEYSYVIDELASWGRFEAAKPDPHFRVLAGSAWRRPMLNPEATTYDLQVKVGEAQHTLAQNGVLDEDSMTFSRDYVFDNWSAASRIVSGKAQYSGGRHWQRIGDDE
jgi:hypothetical protein